MTTGIPSIGAVNFNANSLNSISGKTFSSTAQVKTAQNEIDTQVTLLNSNSQGGSTETSNQFAELNNLKTILLNLKNQLETLKQQIETKEKELKENQELLKQEENNLAKISAEMEANRDEYAEINKAIESATSEISADMKQQQQQIINTTMAQYDKNEHGDFNAYLSKQLTGVLPDTALSSLVKSLGGISSDLCQQFGALQSEYNAKLNVVSATKTTIDDITSELSALNAQIAPLETNIKTTETKIKELDPAYGLPDGPLGLVSEAEKNLVKSNNIDLTETYPNGNPKYIIAKGKSDNSFHIYEMNEDHSRGTSLARKYAPGNGFDIVPNGNGYMSSVDNNPANGGMITYNITSTDACLKTAEYNSSGKCYSTCSPLSFDLNGDGVKTSDKMIKYDIDGDGVIDNINDSADGILCFDRDGNGLSGETGMECFGNNTDLDGDGKADGYKDGFEALKALAFKEGLINGKDDNILDAKDLKILEEKWGLRMKTNGYNGEASSLASLGITEINLAKTSETLTYDNFDEQYNQLMTQEGATFKINGEERDYADIWHAKK